MAKVLDHSSHWQQWWQYTDPETNTKLVRCAKCDHVWLYWGEIPLNSKDVLELDLEQPILKERPNMPNTTNQPPFRVVNPPTHDETYESDLNYDEQAMNMGMDDSAVNSPATNGQTVAMPKDISSSEVNVMGAFVEITSTFSRTIADPGNDRFGSITVGLSIKEMFPGEMQAPDIVDIAEGHYIMAKEKVLSELQLPFQQDQTSKMILEVFPGARTVSQTERLQAKAESMTGKAPTEAAPAPAQPPAARFGTSRTAQPQQASSGPRSGPAGQSGQWEPAPSQAELKRELLDYPHLWFPDPSKTPQDSKPDFISTHYQNDRGYPAGIWIEGSLGPNFTPDELDTLNTVAPEDFAQTRPRTPGNRR